MMAVELLTRSVWVPERLKARLDRWSPKSDLGKIVFACFEYLPTDLATELLDSITRSVIVESSLRAVRLNGPRSDRPGTRDDYGVVSRKVVTNNGVAHIVNAFRNTVEAEAINYHGIGTGTNAEAAADSALQTELTTQYNPDSTRATGTQSAPSANIYQSVGTNAVDATVALTEHGLLSQAATGGGVLFDRSLFTVINLVSGDSLQTTYQATFTAGG